MEKFPGPRQEVGDDNKSKKRKSRKTTLPLASLVETGETPQKPQKKERSPLAEALAELAVKKRAEDKADSAADTDEQKKKTESDETTDSASTENTEADVVNDEAEVRADAEREDESDDKEDDHGKDSEAYESLPNYELGATEFSGGEVIVHLQGDEPVEERVIESSSVEDEGATEDHSNVVERSVTIEHPVRLPQSQHEAPQLAHAMGGGEVPPTIPPESPATPFEQPPERPEQPQTPMAYPEQGYSQPEPAQIYREYMQREAAQQQTTASEQSVSKEDLDDAVYAATKAGQNRGVAAGLLAGAGYEHFKHKRREKKAEKRYQTQSKQLEAARQDYRANLQDREQRQQATEHRLASTERQLNDVERRFANQTHVEKQPPRNLEQPVQDEQLNIPAEHRMESSAWHTIEVDARTGKPVENPTFQYGHEYHRERAQEGSPAQQSNSATGEVALVTAATVEGQVATPPGSDTSLPPLNVPSATVQGPPSAARKQVATKLARTKPRSSGRQQTAPLWPWLIALAVIVICLALVLH